MYYKKKKSSEWGGVIKVYNELDALFKLWTGIPYPIAIIQGLLHILKNEIYSKY